MNSLKQWLQSHSTAILASMIAVAKAGVLGKVGLAFVTALVAAMGG